MDHPDSTLALNVGVHLDVYEAICFKLGILSDNVQLCMMSLGDFDPHPRSQRCEKVKSVPVVSQSFRWIWMDVDILLRFKGRHGSEDQARF